MNKNNSNQLISASKKGEKDRVIELLKKKNIRVDLKDDTGKTALMWASFSGHIEIVKELLKAGACIDQTSDLGKSALDFAKAINNLEIINFLEKFKAHIKIENKKSKSKILSIFCLLEKIIKACMLISIIGMALLFMIWGQDIIEIPSFIEMPLSFIDSIAVDSKENIYIANAFWGRVQIYNKSGSFIKAINFPLGLAKGEFLLSIDHEDNLWIWKRTSLLLFKNDNLKYFEEFDERSNIILSQEGIPYIDHSAKKQCTFLIKAVNKGEKLFPHCSRNSPAPSYEFMDKKGIKYEIFSRVFFPSICSYKENKVSFVVITPWYLMPFSFPSPGVAILALLVFILSRLENFFRSRYIRLANIIIKKID